MTNSKSNQPKENGGNDGIFAVFALALVGCAVWYQKEAAIKYWLYQNLMTIVIYAFVAVAGLVAYALYRIKKKHENELARARAIQSVKPTQSPRGYYERRRPYE